LAVTAHHQEVEAEASPVREEPAPSDDGFVVFYGDHLLPMVRLAHLITGSNLVAEDLVHEAFLKVRARGDRIDRPGAYLRTSVVNECRMWLRRRSVEERNAGTSHERPVLPPELDETWAALERLTPRRRIALVLRFYEDLTVEGVAEVMGCRVGTAKSLIHRGLESLRKELTDAD
jgi:RNA polymerase sigma factor (sigma-70 family)